MSYNIIAQKTTFGYAAFMNFPMKMSAQFDLYNCFLMFMYKRYSGEDIRQQTEALKMMNSARNEVVNDTFSSLSTSFAAHEEYLRLLCAAENRFPINISHTKTMEYEYLSNIKFAWTDAFKTLSVSQLKKLRIDSSSPSLSEVVVCYNTVDFEKACVLYNYAALLANFGKDQSLITDAGLTAALKYFQRSLGVFEHLRIEWAEKGRIPGRKTLDFLPDSLRLMEIILTAQIQICFTQMAKEKGGKSALLASLAMKSSLLYKEAIRLCKLPVFEGLAPSAWVPYFSFLEKYYLFKANHEGSKASKAKATEAGKGFGEEVARLSLSIKNLEEAIAIAKRHTMPFDLSDILKDVTKEKELAAKDLKVIYFESEAKDVSSIEPRDGPNSIPIEPDLVVPVSIGSTDSKNQYFQTLLPAELREVDERFKSRIPEIAKIINDLTTSSLSDVINTLASEGIPACIESVESGPNVFPSSTWNRIVAQVHSVGGIRANVETPAKNEAVASILKNKLRDIELAINAESEVDKTFFNSRSSEDNISIVPFVDLSRNLRDDINTYRNFLLQAQRSDDGMKQYATQYREEFSLLSLSLTELNARLPVANVDQDPKVKAIRANIYDLIGQMEKKVNEIREEKTRYLKDINDYSPAKKLIRDNPNYRLFLSDKGAVSLFIESELKFFKDLAGTINLKVQELKLLVSQILMKNKEFMTARTQTKEQKEREEFISKIDRGIQYFDVYYNLVVQGNNFYKDISNYINKIEDISKNLIAARQRQRDEIVVNEKAKAVQSSGYKLPSWAIPIVVPPSGVTLSSVKKT